MTQALAIGLGIIVVLSLIVGIARLLYSTSRQGRNSTRMHRMGWLVLALVFLSTSTVACTENDDTIIPTAQVITGEATIDEVIVDTVDAIETGASVLCKACQLAEGLPGGNMDNCENICNDKGE